jgi:hypothetical protein
MDYLGAVSNFAVGEAFAVDVSVGEVVVGKMVINSVASKAELDAGGKRKTHAEFTLNKVLDAVSEDSVAAHLKENLTWSVVKSVSLNLHPSSLTLSEFPSSRTLPQSILFV